MYKFLLKIKQSHYLVKKYLKYFGKHYFISRFTPVHTVHNSEPDGFGPQLCKFSFKTYFTNRPSFAPFFVKYKIYFGISN